MILNYFRKTGAKRLLVMFVGNVMLAIGIGIFKFSELGNDPFSAMVMALSEYSGIVYATFLILFNICLFSIQLLFGRKLIGAGTLVNAFLVGYIVTFSYDTLVRFFDTPTLLWQKLLVLTVGIIITSFGVSCYQTPDAGVAPYDSISLMITRKTGIPYFWNRIATDAVCTVICYLAGGILGIGTLICAFGLGPFVHFFNEKFTKKIVGKIEY